MALLDFIKNRGEQRPAGEQQSQQQSETYKQKMTRETTEEKASAKPITQIPAEHQAKVDAVKADMAKATQYEGQAAQPAPSPVPTDGTENQQPMVQKSMGQDNASPDLSPTSAQAGVRAQDVEGPSAPASTPATSQQQTVARPAPSWER